MHIFSFKKRLNIDSFFTRILISYILVIIITITSLSFILYRKFSNSSLSEIESNMKQMLSQNMNNMEFIRNHVFSLGFSMLDDLEIMNGMYSSEILPVQRYHLTNKVNDMVDADPLLYSIYIFNGKRGEVVNNQDINRPDFFDREILSLLKNYNIVYNQVFIPRHISYIKYNDKKVEQNIISVIFADNLSVKTNNNYPDAKYQQIDGAVVINLDADYIRKSMSALLGNQKSNTIIVDKSGQVICDSYMDMFDSNLSSREYIREILNSNDTEGYRVLDINGEKTLLTFLKDIKMPLVYINIAPYSSIFKKLHDLRMYIIVICVLIFFIGLILSMLAVRNVYIPFSKLLDSLRKQAGELKSSLKDNMPLLRKGFLNRVLDGNFSPKNLEKEMHRYGIGFNSEKTFIMIVSVDSYSKIVSGLSAREGLEVLKHAITSRTLNFVSTYAKVETADFKEDTLTLIVNTDTEGKINLKKEIVKLQKIMEKELRITVSIAVGLSVKSLESIQLSYTNALELIKYRYIYGYNSLIFNDTVKFKCECLPNNIDKYKERLICAVRECRKEAAEEELEELFKLLRGYQYNYIMLVINQLVLDLLKSIGSVMGYETQDLNFNNVYNSINTQETLEGTKLWYVDFCRHIIDRLKDKKSGKNVHMIKNAVEYIDGNYCSSDICAESLADMAGITPGYFGRIFTEYTGKTVSEYIIKKRLQRAMELLNTTEMTVRDITSEVGFSNSAYFIRVFKKNVGITPKQYRTESRPM